MDFNFSLLYSMCIVFLALHRTKNKILGVNIYRRKCIIMKFDELHEIENEIFSFFIRFLHLSSCIYWNFDDIFLMYSCNYIIYKLYHKLFGYFVFYKIIIYNNCHVGTVGKKILLLQGY